MATQKQIDSARRNGARSRGPITTEGKAKSARNALKHGLAADPEIILNVENAGDYERLLEAYIDTYKPANGDEYDLVCQAVSASWRLRRIGRMEVGLLEDQMHTTDELLQKFNDPPASNNAAEAKAFRSLANTGRALDLVLRYTSVARRCFDAALKTLRDLQRERRKVEAQNEPDSAKPYVESTMFPPASSSPRPVTNRRLSNVAVFPASSEASPEPALQSGLETTPMLR